MISLSNNDQFISRSMEGDKQTRSVVAVRIAAVRLSNAVRIE